MTLERSKVTASVSKVTFHVAISWLLHQIPLTNQLFPEQPLT